MAKPIQFLAQVEKVSANADRTMSIRLETNELSPDDASKVLCLMNLPIYCALAELPLKESDLDIPEISTEFKSDKTPSQRFRNRLWVYFKSINGSDKGFKEWYEELLEVMGKKYLDKIEQ